VVRLIVSLRFYLVEEKRRVNMIFQLHFIEQVAIFNKTAPSDQQENKCSCEQQCSNSMKLRTISRKHWRTDFSL